MKEKYFVLITLYLKVLISRVGSCGFKKAISIMDNIDNFNSNYNRNQLFN